MNMTPPPPPPPPPPPRDTDRPEASSRPKRAWTKPTLKKMSYVYMVASGPHLIDGEEKVKYVPTSS